MRYAVLLFVALMLGPVLEASAANSSPSQPSIWFVSEGGQGSQGKTADAISAIKMGRYSPDPEIQALAEDAAESMLLDLRETQRRNGQQ